MPLYKIYLLWLAIVFILYWPCRWYAGVKQRHKSACSATCEEVEMKRLALLAAFALPVWAIADTPKAPPTRTDNVETLHGVEIIDRTAGSKTRRRPRRGSGSTSSEIHRTVLGKLPGRDELHQRIAEVMCTDR